MESVTEPNPPGTEIYFEKFAKQIAGDLSETNYEIKNKCPITDCLGTLKSLPIPREAFMRGKRSDDPVKTSICDECSILFAHYEVLKARLIQYAELNTNKRRIRCIQMFSTRPRSWFK